MTMMKSDPKAVFESTKNSLSINNVKFLANVSHEIRNPLNAVIGVARLLKQTESEEDRQKYIDILLETSGDLLELINNIMDFSKFESGKIDFSPREVDLRELVTKNVSRQKSIAESKGLNLVLEVDKDLPPLVIIDPIKINQVLTNLISNAIKFTPEGSVSVNLNIIELKGDKVSVRCTVKDTGIGIPEEKVNAIFDAFNQGDMDINSTYGGTGLGLTISRQIINTLGGDLQVKSCIGRGSEFSFLLTLKISRSPDFHPLEVEEIPKERLPQGIKVLVVDDNRVNVLVVQKHLELWGIGYEIAHNGLNAVKKIQQQDFDLVLMDLHMPEMDGLEATEAIRHLMDSKRSRLPIIALTASTERFYQGDLQAAGFSDFLIKPFAPKELINKIILHTKEMTTGYS